MWDAIKRAWEVAKTSLDEERKRPREDARTEDERAFLAHALEILDTPASPIGRTIVWILIAFLTLTIAWACFGELDITATATGKVIPTGHVKVIEPFENGTVRAVHVEDGDGVKAGDLLIELDPTEAVADRDRLAYDLMNAQLDASRLKATIAAAASAHFTGFPPEVHPEGADSQLLILHSRMMEAAVGELIAERYRIDGQIGEDEAQLVRLTKSVAEREQLVSTLRERTQMEKTLLEKGYSPRVKVLEISGQLHQESALMESERGQKLQINAAIETLQRQRRELDAKFIADAMAKLAEAAQKAENLKQELKKAALRDERNRLRAPVDGIVQQVAIHTVGDVVTTAEKLMIVVPYGNALEVEAMVLNKDKGFVNPKDLVAIKVESFPFTKYGTIPGRVVNISNDAVSNEKQGLLFPVRVALDRTTIRVDGADQVLSPGMAVTAEVKTGSRKVIEYVLTPLLRYRDEAMTER